MSAEMLLLAVALGSGVGFLLGLLGGGGSILTVPILVYVMGQSTQAAIRSSLVIVGVSSLAAAWGHARAGDVQLRVGLLFGALGGATALLGVWLNHRVSDETVLLGLALVMALAAVGMLRRGAQDHQPTSQEEISARSPSWPKVVGAGMGVGLLTGFFGIGGGFITVPALAVVAGLSMHLAVGTSLVATTLQSAWGLLGHLRYGGVDWQLTGAFLLGSLSGGSLGTRLSGRMDSRSLSRMFGLLLLTVAAYLVYRNYGVFLGS